MTRSTIGSSAARLVPPAFFRLTALGSLLLSVAVAGEGEARAEVDPSGRAMADALFKEGKKLFAKGDYAEACQKFEASYQIDPAGGTLINLALCHEKEGKTATAWGEFTDALAMAKKAHRFDRQKIAKAHIAAIEPKLSRFVLSVAPAGQKLEGLEVTIDGVVLQKGAWGTPMPVDPGAHTAAATAPEHQRWESRFEVGEADEVKVEVPALNLKKIEKPKPPPPPPPPPPSWKRPVGFTAIGVGALSLGVGAVFGVRAITLGSDVATNCPNGVCNIQGYSALSDGRSSATVANVLVGVGLVAAGAGTFLVLTSGSKSEPAKSTVEVGAAPSPGMGGGFLTVRGVF